MPPPAPSRSKKGTETMGLINHPLRFVVFGILLVIVSPSAKAQNTDAFVTNYIKALNSSMPPNGDPTVVANMFTENGAQYDINLTTQKGREQIQQFFAGFKNLFRDWTHIERMRFVQGNHAIWEGTAEGHDKTGKYLQVPLVFSFDFDDQGKVREVRVYARRP
jgi:SnoaL-like domain